MVSCVAAGATVAVAPPLSTSVKSEADFMEETLFRELEEGLAAPPPHALLLPVTEADKLRKLTAAATRELVGFRA